MANNRPKIHSPPRMPITNMAATVNTVTAEVHAMATVYRAIYTVHMAATVHREAGRAFACAGVRSCRSLIWSEQ